MEKENDCKASLKQRQFLFKSPKKRGNKTRTKWVTDPNEGTDRPERRYCLTRTKVLTDPNEDTA